MSVAFYLDIKLAFAGEEYTASWRNARSGVPWFETGIGVRNGRDRGSWALCSKG
jgi:hypothetical protein